MASSVFHLRLFSATTIDDLPDLTDNNFEEFVGRFKYVFVMYYDPYCGHCRAAMPEFAKAADAFINRTNLAFAMIDGPANQNLCMTQNIDAFPTFRLYTNTTHKYKEYSGTKKATDFITYLNNQVKFLRLDANELRNVSVLLTTVRFYSRDLSPRNIKVGNKVWCLSENIVLVDDSSFHEKIRHSSNALVCFYTSWCSKCSLCLPPFLEASEYVNPSVGLMVLCNAEESLETVDRYRLCKLPSLKYFRCGEFVADYFGEWTVDGMVAFMHDPPMTSPVELNRGGQQLPTIVPRVKRCLWKDLNDSDRVTELNNENFDSILNSHDSLLVLFYTCWSKASIRLACDYVQVARRIEETCDSSKIAIAACDCEENVELADKFLITKFPKIKYFRNGQFVADYLGEEKVDEILKFLVDPTYVGPSISSHLPVPPHQKISLEVPPYWRGIDGGDCILHLNDFNFQKTLLEHGAVLVVFYVSWCKSCSVMKREYGRAAKLINSAIGRLGACDAEENNVETDKFNVTKLPTIKYFRMGDFVTNYTGDRTAKDILEYVYGQNIFSC